MAAMELLLLSNSTNYGGSMFSHAAEAFAEVSAGDRVTFVPYALADWDDYDERATAALGAFGIESFTPVLYAPQVAILGVDAIVPRAAAGPNGTVVLEQRIGLSITVDHQIIDGAPAARLLKAFADAIADIDLLLMA